MSRALLVRRAAAALVACALSAACAPSLPPGYAPPAAYDATLAARAEAQDAYLAGRWDDASRLYRRQAEIAARDEHLAGWRKEALYNLACVEARAGRRAESVKAFADCVAGGLPEPAVFEDGRWRTLGPVLTLPHVLVDPDLDSVRDDPGFRAALAPYLAAGETKVLDVGAAAAAADGARRPAIVVLSAFATTAEATDGTPAVFEPDAGAWATAAPGRPRIVAAISGPIRRGPEDDPLTLTTGGATSRETIRTPPVRHWRLDDGDLRWAVDAVRAALDRLAADPRVDPDRVYLAAVPGQEGAADAAWAAALVLPERIAGFAVAEVTTPRPAWADALADVARRREGKPAWHVVLGPGADAAGKALAAAGASVDRTGADDLPRAALALWR